MHKNYLKYALFMKALSDATRINIFEMLAQGELCACKILEDFQITQPTLSYHMKILCESGLVSGRKDGVWMKYSIRPDSLEAVKEFYEEIGKNLKPQNKCTGKCSVKC